MVQTQTLTATQQLNNKEQTTNNSSLKSLQLAMDMIDSQTIDQTCSSPPERPSIYPPLSVRLQKLNEKSVALKWNHNPNNVFPLHGYNIYINDELCGKMKFSDTVAAINGIQEVGEYRIYVRSFYLEFESENSNQVITRLKKKEKSTATGVQNKTGEQLKDGNFDCIFKSLIVLNDTVKIYS